MAHFALVNTFTNAAGELVAERMIPEPCSDFDMSEIPPPPDGSPPRTFVPSDEGSPTYQAYVPLDADPGFDYTPARDRVPVKYLEASDRKINPRRPRKGRSKTTSGSKTTGTSKKRKRSDKEEVELVEEEEEEEEEGKEYEGEDEDKDEGLSTDKENVPPGRRSKRIAAAAKPKKGR